MTIKTMTDGGRSKRTVVRDLGVSDGTVRFHLRREARVLLARSIERRERKVAMPYRLRALSRSERQFALIGDQP